MAEPENTPPGDDVEVSDPETGTTLLFDAVDSGGETTVTITQHGPPPPTGLKLVPLGTYYEINTTAEFSGMVQVAIKYDDTGLTGGQERALKLRCYDEETDEWVNITTALDMENNIIYGETDHLSFFAITVDTTPPTINSVSASRDVLWPPNHKMVEVIVSVDATDICDPEPFSYILGVSSNEPINGPGDGNTEPDWELFTDEPLVVMLRAESAGVGIGRVYTIYVECTDASGNIATAEVDVVVPHDQGKGKKGK